LGALALAVLAGCGDELPAATPDAAPVVTIDAGGCATPVSARLLPLAVGTTWTYQVTPTAGATPVFMIVKQKPKRRSIHPFL